MTIWRIFGEAATDSAGGDMTIYAVTDSNVTPPDAHKALRSATAGRWKWYQINTIEMMAEIPGAWDHDDPYHSTLMAPLLQEFSGPRIPHQ